MTVLVDVDWVNGSENLTPTPDEFTMATPDVPNGFVWYGIWADVAVESASPWNGQTLIDCTGNWQYGLYNNAVGSSHVNVNAGRILIQWETSTITDSSNILEIACGANNSQWRLRITRDVATIDVSLYWDSFSDGNESLNWITGLQIGDDLNMELIYNLDEAVAADRMRLRNWTVGGSPGSFASTTTVGVGSGTRTQPDVINLGSFNNVTTFARFGRFIISDDISEDLSARLAGDAAPFPFRNRTVNNTLLRM